MKTPIYFVSLIRGQFFYAYNVKNQEGHTVRIYTTAQEVIDNLPKRKVIQWDIKPVEGN